MNKCWIFFFIIVIVANCSTHKNIQVEPQHTSSGDDRVAKIFLAWHDNSSTEDIHKIFGPESILKQTDHGRQLWYMRGRFLPEIVFDLDRNDKVIAILYRPEKMTSAELKSAVNCQEWAIDTSVVQNKDVLIHETVLACPTVKVSARLSGVAEGRIDEIWFGNMLE